MEKLITRTNLQVHYVSITRSMEILECSKFYLYKLIKSGRLKRHYPEIDENGNPKGKPYISLEEINNLFTPEKK